MYTKNILKAASPKRLALGINFDVVNDTAPAISLKTISKNPKACWDTPFVCASLLFNREFSDISITPMKASVIAMPYLLFKVSPTIKYATMITKSGKVLLRRLAIARYTFSKPAIIR